MSRETTTYAVNQHVMPENEAIDEMLRGSVDMHIHCAPDPGVSRRADAVEIALTSQERGMRAVVLKSFTYTTTMIQKALKHVAPDIDVFGSICIGSSVGGLNAGPVEEQAKMGCKVCWMPALDSYYFKKAMNMSGGIKITDDDYNLLPETKEILEVIRDYNMVLCTGHVPFKESYPLLKEAKEMGIKKMVATHPFSFIPTHLTMEQALAEADLGAVVEFTVCEFSPRLGSIHPSVYVNAVHKIGAERCLISSDYGQAADPLPVEGFRNGIGLMMYFGVTEEEMTWMAKKNPYKLLDLV